MRRALLVLILFSAKALQAQQPVSPPPDPPGELQKLSESCLSFTFSGLGGCAEELFTGVPLHIAVGSIAPQDGFGAGVAYVGHHTTTNWRNTWNADAIATGNASWRAGFYMRFVHTPSEAVGVSFGPPPPAKENLIGLTEHTVFGLYAQSTSLNKITFFGLGPDTTEAGRTFFGMTETIVGGNVVKPLSGRLNASLFGEMNGRFVSIRESNGQVSPSIGKVYDEATAPGLTTQPGTFQLGEGMRIRPVFDKDLVRLNYSVAYQQYFATDNFTFQRLTIDLGHQYALHSKTRINEPRLNNGPDACAVDPVSHPACPKPYVRNFEGSIGFRFFTALSMTPGGNAVPFYFQPTLGGSDINGNSSLSSYQDYRFRAPDVLFLREIFEHSIWDLPIGFTLMADEGKVALTRGGLGSSPWIHSFSTGLTLRAGGFPQVYLLFSWGGKEGTHTIANVNTSLLGGTSRPSLF
ncbi:MAG: hypothetical protein WA639_25925 [Candidatus Acidiferrum sp.]